MSLELYRSCIAQMQTTADQFGDLMVEDVRTWPLPWFGDLANADILTIGVNPSANEFRRGRWQNVEGTSAAWNRAVNYFRNPLPPDPWFVPWETALSKIAASYQPRVRFLAAHLDLSPRATKAMRTVPSKRFLEMINSDFQIFLTILSNAQNCRGILMAGTVTRRWYMNALIATMATQHPGYRLEGPLVRDGKGFVNYHTLHLPDRQFPVFFCSTSPSARDSSLLVNAIAHHRQRLLDWLTLN